MALDFHPICLGSSSCTPGNHEPCSGPCSGSGTSLDKLNTKQTLAPWSRDEGWDTGRGSFPRRGSCTWAGGGLGCSDLDGAWSRTGRMAVLWTPGDPSPDSRSHGSSPPQWALLGSSFIGTQLVTFSLHPPQKYGAYRCPDAKTPHCSPPRAPWSPQFPSVCSLAPLAQLCSPQPKCAPTTVVDHLGAGRWPWWLSCPPCTPRLHRLGWEELGHVSPCC